MGNLQLHLRDTVVVCQILLKSFRMMNFLLLSMAVSLVIGSPKPASIFRESSSLSGSSAPYDKKAAMLKELEDAQLLKELEILVKNLDDDQLDKLEAIMGKDIDEVTEFEMIMAELKEMGMEDEDIADLKQLAQLMHEFLSQVPDLATKLELESDYDLAVFMGFWGLALLENPIIAKDHDRYYTVKWQGKKEAPKDL